MEFAVTKKLLNFLLRFRCPNCEFSTLEASPIQKHLRQCMVKNNFVIEHVKKEIKTELDIKDEFCKVPIKMEESISIKKDPDEVIEEEFVIEHVEEEIKPQIEAVLCGETAKILFEMIEDDDDLEYEMKNDENSDPKLETKVYKEGEVGQLSPIENYGQITQFGQLGQMSQIGQPEQVLPFGQKAHFGQPGQIQKLRQSGHIQQLEQPRQIQQVRQPRHTRVNESVYRSYYNKITFDSSKCRYCPAILSTIRGSTSGLKKHLVSRHKKMYLKEVKPKEDARKNTYPNRKKIVIVPKLETDVNKGQVYQNGHGSQIGQVGPLSLVENNGQIPQLGQVAQLGQPGQIRRFGQPGQIQRLGQPGQIQQVGKPRHTRVNESVYRSYYNKITFGSSKCRYCPAIISTIRGSTSGLKKHLVSRHKKMYLKEVKPKVDARKNTYPDRNNLSKHISFCHTEM